MKRTKEEAAYLMGVSTGAYLMGLLRQASSVIPADGKWYELRALLRRAGDTRDVGEIWINDAEKK